MDSKNDRLQLRMAPKLKSWFREYSARRGGMSAVVHRHVETLFEEAEGHAWWRHNVAEKEASGSTERGDRDSGDDA